MDKTEYAVNSSCFMQTDFTLASSGPNSYQVPLACWGYAYPHFFTFWDYQKQNSTKPVYIFDSCHWCFA